MKVKKTNPIRKTPSSRSTSERVTKINRGELETKNLAECLKVDFAILYPTLFPMASGSSVQAVGGLAELGILKRMENMGRLLLENHGSKVLPFLEKQNSDTARGWAAFVVGHLPGLSLKQRLEEIKTYADDSHFGVREWAWMAVRKYIAEDLQNSIEILSGWTTDESFRVRRFASEATRPRGVWAEHISLLKEKPELGLPILQPLRNDPERYVQDSVANWLNDAAKTQPRWVKKICTAWSKQSSEAPTSYIVKRATRSMK